MLKFPSLKCPICGKAYKEVPAFGNHVRTEHPGTIPEGWTDLRYAYFVHTGKDRGRCRECGGETPWNEVTGAYSKICTSEVCKKKFRDRVMEGMRARYGKSQGRLLADPKYRERMLTNRKISGEYTFHDGGKVAYMGTLEKAFVQMLDNFFRFPSSDILSPSPNRYRYYYENPNDMEHAGEHWYVPDFYIPSCNLEIELKAGNNQRPKNLMIDVRKDAAKDIAMIRNPMVNYIKIYENDYHVFFQVFSDLAAQQMGTGPKKPIKYISRTLLTSIYRDYIPDDCLAILDNYIYKYSEKSVLKKPAKESESIYLEDIGEPAEEEEIDPDITIDEYYSQDEEEEDAETTGDLVDNDSVGVNPMMYYQLGEYAPEDSARAEETVLDIFSFDGAVNNLVAMESLKDQVDSSKIDGRAALKFRTWKEKLFGSGFLGQKVTSAFTKVTIENGRILIKGINCNLLLYRIKETFSESKLKYIFEYQYNEKSWKLYQKKKIGRGDMKIDYVYAPEFFCIELVELFTQLADRYNDTTYKTIASLIYQKSWMSTADNSQVPPLSLDPLKNIDNVELMDHQKLFIEKWPQLKHQLNLHGYILAFQPGKGKTLTAVGLAECVKTDKVYIVCPNNLKDNWALELKKYYSKYSRDEKAWMRDVCILGTSYGNPKTAKWFITNNENIKLMMPYAQKDPDAMLILDESHNFRNYSGSRSEELFNLADKIGSNNVLCVSATPIKAVPAEIAPALRLIDPTFNDEAAVMYTKCFDLSTTMAMGIVNKRFGKIIYRPADVQVDLPPKTIEDLSFHIKSGEERFYLDTVHDEVIQDYNRRHEAWLKESKQASDEFNKQILKYSTMPHKETVGYLSWVRDSASSMRGGSDYHELSVAEYQVFIDRYIRSNPSCPAAVADELEKMAQYFIAAAKRDMGKAAGTIVPKRRNELFIQLYEDNKETIYEMIRKRSKKTIIFSTMVPVIRYIAKDMDQIGIGNVVIMGETKDRLAALTKFREDPNCLVLIATSWCMGTGVTLTNASQMFFFAAPWRSTDYEQAWSRIWRIGQTDPVNIYNVRLQSRKMNLSDRMNKILEWSDKMFNASITANSLDGVSDEEMKSGQASPATETYRQQSTFQILTSMMKVLEDYEYGLFYQGKIQDPEDKSIYNKYYRTLSPGKFSKVKGGICFDFAAFQDFYCKAHSLASDNYFLEVFGGTEKEPLYVTHAFTVVRDGVFQMIYPERAFADCEGIWRAKDLSEIVSYIVNHITKNWKNRDIDFKCYSLRTRWGYYDETMNEFLARARSGKQLPITWNKRIWELEPYEDTGDNSYVIESFTFNDHIDSPQYDMSLADQQLKALSFIRDTYMDLGDSKANPVGGILGMNTDSIASYYSGFMGWTHAGDYQTNHFYSPWDCAKYLRGELMDHDLSVVSVCLFLKPADERFRGPIIFPMTLVPFEDGALYIERGISPKRNRIYFVKSIAEAANAAVAWILETINQTSLKDYGNAEKSLRMIPPEVWGMLPNIRYKSLFEMVKHGEFINIDWSKPQDYPWKVEVLKRGWIVDRF